jgi:hypothetical protein
MRTFIPAAQLRRSGKTFRITLMKGALDYKITNMYVGHSGIAFEAGLHGSLPSRKYDFDGNQVRVTFNGGNPGCTVTTSANVVSDEITFNLYKHRDLVFSFYVDDEVYDIYPIATQDGATGVATYHSPFSGGCNDYSWSYPYDKDYPILENTAFLLGKICTYGATPSTTSTSSSSSSTSSTIAGGWVDTIGPLEPTMYLDLFSSCGLRQVFYAEKVTTSGTSVRITLLRGDTESYKIDKMYIGHRSGTGCDFDGGQVKVTFNGGSNGCTVTTSADVLSDEITFSVDETKDLILSFYTTDGDYDKFPYESAEPSVKLYYKDSAGSDTALTTVSDYSSYYGTFVCIKKIEVS